MRDRWLNKGSLNGWPKPSTNGDLMTSSLVMSSSSPRLSSEVINGTYSLDRRRKSESSRPRVDHQMLVPPVADEQSTNGNVSWQLLSITLHQVPSIGFGIAVSGGKDNPHFTSGDTAVVVSDVVPSGPAWGLVQVNDRILSANGVSLENAEYEEAVKIMKESQQLNMIVKRRAPVPLIEFEQRTLKFTLSKSRKKEDFGILLGCKFYIKEITNKKLAEKDPGLREGDTVLRINGQSVDGISVEEATKWLTRSREKLSLVVQRDVRRGTTRWPSQTTVYERLGSVSSVTPRHSPSPMLNSHQPLTARHSSECMNSSSTSNANDYYRGASSICSSQGGRAVDSDVRVVRFRKLGGSLGVRVIGGNQVGIFVSAVQDDSPAAANAIRPGDRIVSVNDKSMLGVTREEAVRQLLAIGDDVVIKVEYAPNEFEHVRSNQLGDSFYIRTHFANHKASHQLELTFNNGDLFHVSDTLFGGTVGLWQATRVYSTSDSSGGGSGECSKGVIPNAETAETLAKASRIDSSTLGRSTFFRRKLKDRRSKSLTKNIIDDLIFNDGSGDLPLPAYERVALRHPPFQRPIILYGPLADVARQMLLSNFALRFGSTGDDNMIRLSSIDAVINANKHCLLDVSPGSVERLQLAQYAPIVILIDVDSRSRIRELRAKAGAPSLSTRKLLEQTQKIKKHHSHLLTATLDASREDGWFEALRQLIAHLQDCRVWMPEFRPTSNLSDVVLLSMQGFSSHSDSDVDSMKGEYTDFSPRRPLPPELDASIHRSFYDPQCSDHSINSLQRPHLPSRLHSLRAVPPPSPGYRPFIPASYYQNIPVNSEISNNLCSRVMLQTANNSSSFDFEYSSPSHRPSNVPPMSGTIPWATLPRRLHPNVGRASSTSASPPVMSTTPIDNIHQQRFGIGSQHSPIVARKPQIPAKVTRMTSPGLQRSPIGDPHRTTTSPFIASNSTQCESMHLTQIDVVNSTNVPSQENTTIADWKSSQKLPPSPGYFDVKQILAEQAGNDTSKKDNTNSTQKFPNQNPSSAFSSVIRPSRSPLPEKPPITERESLKTINGYETNRNRWGNNTVNEKVQTVDPVCASRPIIPPPGPSQTNSLVGDSSIRYVDESPKSPTARPLNSGKNDENASILLAPKSLPEAAETYDNCPEASDNHHIADNHTLPSCPKKFPTIDIRCSSEIENEAAVIEHIAKVIDTNGGTLQCPESGVVLIVPEGAIKHGTQQEIYVKVCRASTSDSRPPLDESRGESLMSPLVMCGPQNLHFDVPVELRLPHSASNNGENWSFALKSGTGNEWNRTTLDNDTSSLVTDKYVSVKIDHF